MNFEDIKTFIVLAETSSFSKTANQLLFTQSTISSRIKAMEKELGKQLIIRNTKHFELTPAGLDFLDYAKQINQLYMESFHSSGRYTEKISIGAPISVWDSLLLPPISEYMLTNPDISFELIGENSWIVNQQAVEGTLDIGIVLLPTISYPHISSEVLKHGSYVLVASCDMPLETEMLTKENIHQFRFIHYALGPSFDEWFSKHYHKYAHFIEVANPNICLHLIRSKVGVSFLPIRTAQKYIDSGEFRVIPFEGEDSIPPEEIRLIYNRHREATVYPIVQKIRDYVHNIGLNDAYHI